MNFEINERLNETLTKYIRPSVFPVAVKLSSSAELPERVKRPLRDFGNRINLCQGAALARTYGWTVGFLKRNILVVILW